MNLSDHRIRDEWYSRSKLGSSGKWSVEGLRWKLSDLHRPTLLLFDDDLELLEATLRMGCILRLLDGPVRSRARNLPEDGDNDDH